MDNFLTNLKTNITSSIQATGQTIGDLFGKSQKTVGKVAKIGSQKIEDILSPLEKIIPEQNEFSIPGPTSGSYKPFKNIYVEATAQTLGLGSRDTDVLERLPKATIGALKGAGDGLAQALSFGWWDPEIKYANDVEEMAGKMTEVEFNVLGTIGTFVVGGGLVQGALKGVPVLARVATVAPKTFSVLSNGLTFAGLTQLQKEEASKSAQQRAKDAVSDFALGGAFSIAGMKPSFIKSSAIIGPATYVTSLIKGESGEDALKNTAAMMGLHSLNYAVAKYLPNKSAVESQIEKAASEQLRITKKQALEYLGVNEKATAQEIKQAWKGKVVDITKQFPAQAKQTPQEIGQFNQACNTANRAYEFLSKVSNPTGYTGKTFRQEFQDLYYQLWRDVPNKRAIVVQAVRNMPAGLSIRATLNDAQRNEIVTSLGGQNAKTRLGKVAELTDADLVTVAMENKIDVTPSKPAVERTEVYSLPGELEPARGKPTWKHGKMLWNTMRNQNGQSNRYSRDITVNKGVVSWIIDTLENGLESKKILMTEAKKFQGQAMESRQYKKLYAMFKNKGYDIDGYRKVMATLKGIKPAIIEKTIEPALTKAESIIKPKSIKTVTQTEMLKSMRSGTGKFEVGELYTQKGRPEAHKIIISGKDAEGNILGDYVHNGVLSPAKFKPSELEPLSTDKKTIEFVKSQFGIGKTTAKSGEILDENTIFYHGTSAKNANSLLKTQEFDPLKSTKEGLEAPYALFASTEKGAGSDHFAGTYGDEIIKVLPKKDAVISVLRDNSEKWLNTMGKTKNVKEATKIAEQLRQEGYDVILEASGEVVVLSPEKFNFELDKPKEIFSIKSVVDDFSKKSPNG